MWGNGRGTRSAEEARLAVGRRRRSGRRARDFTGEFFGETKIGENDVSVCTNENVLGFEVTVNHTGCVQAFAPFHLEYNTHQELSRKSNVRELTISAA